MSILRLSGDCNSSKPATHRFCMYATAVDRRFANHHICIHANAVFCRCSSENTAAANRWHSVLYEVAGNIIRLYGDCGSLQTCKEPYLHACNSGRLHICKSPHLHVCNCSALHISNQTTPSSFKLQGQYLRENDCKRSASTSGTDCGATL